MSDTIIIKSNRLHALQSESLGDTCFAAVPLAALVYTMGQLEPEPLSQFLRRAATPVCWPWMREALLTWKTTFSVSEVTDLHLPTTTTVSVHPESIDFTALRTSSSKLSMAVDLCGFAMADNGGGAAAATGLEADSA
jgi:hypothetical protein